MDAASIGQQEIQDGDCQVSRQNFTQGFVSAIRLSLGDAIGATAKELAPASKPAYGRAGGNRCLNELIL